MFSAYQCAASSAKAREESSANDPTKPAASLTKDLVQAAADDGLIVLACGTRGNVIRFLAPLTV